jgi:hypothetical protein
LQLAINEAESVRRRQSRQMSSVRIRPLLLGRRRNANSNVRVNDAATLRLFANAENRPRLTDLARCSFPRCIVQLLPALRERRIPRLTHIVLHAAPEPTRALNIVLVHALIAIPRQHV